MTYSSLSYCHSGFISIHGYEFSSMKITVSMIPKFVANDPIDTKYL